jgi:hypothetical protein
MRRFSRVLLTGMTLAALAGCAQPQAAYTPVATVADLMEGMVMPAAEVVFEAVYTEVTVEGIREIQPQNDEEWDIVGHNAMALVEAGNMLKFDTEHAAEPDWRQWCQSLMDSAANVAKVAEARDASRMLDAGGVMYEACSGCHKQYLPEEAAVQ